MSMGVNALAMISSEALPCTIGLASPSPNTPSSLQMRTQALRLRPAPQSTWNGSTRAIFIGSFLSWIGGDHQRVDGHDVGAGGDELVDVDLGDARLGQHDRGDRVDHAHEWRPRNRAQAARPREQPRQRALFQ